MAHSARRQRPSSARTIYRALEELGAAPRPDPKHRPNGPRPKDAALLVGVLLAKAELDAAVRADPAQEPPDGLSELLTGYRSTLNSPSDETRLRLLSLRLVRSAFEATLEDDSAPLGRAAGNAALAAAGLIDAERLRRTGATRATIASSVDTAADALHAADKDITAQSPARPI